MMNRISLLILFVCGSFASQAQFNVYHPFPDSNAWWIQHGAHMCSGSFGGSFNLNYFLRADTIIHGETYHIMASTDADQCVDAVPNPPYVYTATAACVREDSMKHVYLWLPLPSYSTYDTLLYDFNMKLGDTVVPTYITETAGGIVTVNSIDSIKIGISFRKQFVLKYQDWGGNTAYDSIVEGMGSWNGVLGPIGPYEFGNESLTCFKHNQDSVGICSNYEQYDGITTEQKLPVKFTIYPNPSGSTITIAYRYQGNSNGVLKLYNEMGQLVSTTTLKSYNTTTQQDISALANGIYYYALSINGTVMATNKLVVIH